MAPAEMMYRVFMVVALYSLISCYSFSGLSGAFTAYAAELSIANRRAVAWPGDGGWQWPWNAPKRRLPRVQFYPPPTETDNERKLRETQRQIIRDTFVHSWKAHAKLSANQPDRFGWQPGTTSAIDALDTLWIMGLMDEWEKVVLKLRNNRLSRKSKSVVNIYELNVRVLGSMLANWEMTGKDPKYKILNVKALEISRIISPRAFETHNGLPNIIWDPEAFDKRWFRRYKPQKRMTLNQLSGFALEFTKLTELTGKRWYWDRVVKCYSIIEHHVPNTFDAVKIRWDGENYGLGKGGEEFYGSLPKLYALLGGSVLGPASLWFRSTFAYQELGFYNIPNQNNVTMLIAGRVERASSQTTYSKYRKTYEEHQLANKNILEQEQCSAGATMGLVGKVFSRKKELEWGQQMTQGCIYAANITQTGLPPQEVTLETCMSPSECEWSERKAGHDWEHQLVAYYAERRPGVYDLFENTEGCDLWLDENTELWDGIGFPLDHKDPRFGMVNGKKLCIRSIEETARFIMKKEDLGEGGVLEVQNRGYYLASETFESLFYMWRITGDKKWRREAWEQFERVLQYTKTNLGHQGILNTFAKDGGGHDTDMRFQVWMGETLKYAYLIFEDWDVLSLDEWVFNAKGHPLRRMDAARPFDD